MSGSGSTRSVSDLLFILSFRYYHSITCNIFTYPRSVQLMENLKTHLPFQAKLKTRNMRQRSSTNATKPGAASSPVKYPPRRTRTTCPLSISPSQALLVRSRSTTPFTPIFPRPLGILLSLSMPAVSAQFLLSAYMFSCDHREGIVMACCRESSSPLPFTLSPFEPSLNFPPFRRVHTDKSHFFLSPSLQVVLHLLCSGLNKKKYMRNTEGIHRPGFRRCR